jgi:pentatricopeptide repeat protein
MLLGRIASQLLLLIHMLTSCLSLQPQQCHHDPRLLSRKIKNCIDDTDKALQLLELADVSDEDPFVQAIQVCGKAGRCDLALRVYHSCPTESCRTKTITVLGKCGKYKEGLELLREGNPSNASYNAVIAACGRAGDWQEALKVLEQMPVDFVSWLTCHAVLTALAKARRGAEALDMLNNMGKWGLSPVRGTYHLAIQALVRQGDSEAAQGALEECREKQLRPHQGTIDMVIASYGKADNWRQVKEGHTNEEIADTTYFHHWHSLKKVSQGKLTYWELGRFQYDVMEEGRKRHMSITVAFQPNRNPRKNGIRLILVDSDGCKLGFLLMLNRSSEEQGTSHDTSSLLGLRIEESFRSLGLCKVFLAIWLHICLEAGIVCVSGKINKPVLALVLQHRFKFEGTGGCLCEATRGDRDNDIVLFSNNAKNLDGAFSSKDRSSQRIIVSHVQAKDGRQIRMGATFVAPETSLLRAEVDEVLQGGLSYEVTSTGLRDIFLGI